MLERCDIDQFCCSSSSTAFKTINTKKDLSKHNNNNNNFLFNVNEYIKKAQKLVDKEKF